MKLLHLADLHFGKTLHNVPLIEQDQPYWVDQLLALAAEEKPKAVLIAGDVYDRGVPCREAVQLLSRMLTELNRMGIPVLMTAGNHDGGERLEFAAELLEGQKVHIAGTVQAELKHVPLSDEHGPVHFWLMPYVFPAAVRTALGLDEDAVSGYSAAVKALLEAQDIDWTQRNVLIAHQTVMSNGCEAEHSASETSVGGVGGVDAALFSTFDYAALGHIHGAQRAGYEHVRYAGAPLCYHFSEADQKKGPLLVTLGEKGSEPTYKMVTLQPLHRVRPTMVGSLEEIIAQEQASEARGEYVRVELTDDWLPPDTHETLRAVFAAHDSQLLDLARAPRRRDGSQAQEGTAAENVSLEEHFLRFYRRQNDMADPSEKDAELIRMLAQQIGDRADADPDKQLDQLVSAVLKQEVED